MTSDQRPTVDDLRQRPHIAALSAGSFCYVYSGWNREKVLDRARAGEFAMTAANLDTAVVWLQPEHFHETYRRLCEATGAANVELMPDPQRPRACLRCGTDLTDTMGVHVFVDGRRADGTLLCTEHGRNGANELRRAEYNTLRQAAE